MRVSAGIDALFLILRTSRWVGWLRPLVPLKKLNPKGFEEITLLSW